MRERGGVRRAAGLGRWLSARGWCAVVVVGMPLVTAAANAPASAGYMVTGAITVGIGPVGVAVDPAAGTVYVTNEGDGTVSVIDTATSTVTGTIPVGSGPAGVAVDSAARTVYVTNQGSSTVSVIDGVTSTVTATVPVGPNPWGVAVNPGTRTAYVANIGDGTVSMIGRCIW